VARDQLNMSNNRSSYKDDDVMANSNPFLGFLDSEFVITVLNPPKCESHVSLQDIPDI
jgi:hypothetical protein